MIKYSRQRQAIKEYLASRKDHPTAEQVYEAVRQMYPSISLGTVYRNLSLLHELGEVSLVVPERAGSEHFDADTTPHHHFFCRRCRRVTDVFLEERRALRRDAEKELGAVIEEEKTIFYGICSSCLNQ